MKKYITILFTFVALAANAQNTTSWVPRNSGYVYGSTSTLPSRSYGVSFAIGYQGYMATGEGPSTLTSALSDCWRYSNEGIYDLWEQRADVPGGGRTQAFGFAINGLGYVGGGAGPSLSYSNALYDFYEYNPGTNTWASKASFITTTTFGVGFIPADRVGSASFVFPNPPFATQAYVIGGGSGLHTSGSAKNTGIQYNPSTNTWSSVYPNFPVPIYDAVGFTLGGNGYVTCGVAHGLSYNPTYMYDGLWHAVSNFPGSVIRARPFVFTLGNSAYAGSGYSTTVADISDVWSYTSGSGWCSVPSFVGGNLAGTTAFTLTVNGIQRPFVQNGALLTILGVPTQIPNNRNYEYQPLFVSTTMPAICTPKIASIPFYNDCSYPTGTVFTAQLVTYDGTNFTVIKNIATTTTGVLRTGMFNITFPSSLTPAYNYALRITASNGPVLMSNITNFFSIGTAPPIPNTLSGPATICVGQSGNFLHNESYVTATGSAGTFNWSTSNGNVAIINSGNINFVPVPPNTNYQNFGSVLGINPGVTTISVSGYFFGCYSPVRTVAVTITGAPLPTIAGSQFITVGGVNVYTVNTFPGTTYQWFSSAASSVAGVSSNGFYTSITGYSYGKVVLTVTAFNTACGTTMNTLTITVANAFYTTTCAGTIPLYFTPDATINTFVGYDLSNPSLKFMLDLTSPKIDFTTYGSNVVLDLGTISGAYTLTISGIYKWNFNNLTIIGGVLFKPGSVMYSSGNIIKIPEASAALGFPYNLQILGSTITGLPCSPNEYDWNYLLANYPFSLTVDAGTDAYGVNRKSLLAGSKNGLIVTGHYNNASGATSYLVNNSVLKATNSGFSLYIDPAPGILPMCAFCMPSSPQIYLVNNQFIRTGSNTSISTTGLYLEYTPGQYNSFIISKNVVNNFYTNIRFKGKFVVNDPVVFPVNYFLDGMSCNTLTGANSNKHLYLTPSGSFNFNLKQYPSGNVFQGSATQLYNDGLGTLTYYIGLTDQVVFSSGSGSTIISDSKYISLCATLPGGRMGNNESEVSIVNSLGAPVPNPASYSVKLPYSIHIEEGQEAFIEVNNMTGNRSEIYKLSYKELEGEIVVDLTEYIPGLYYYRLIVNGKGEDVRKLIVIK